LSTARSPQPPSTPPHNLPLQRTTFIGRERELEEVCERLRRDEVRLLTLTGAGGSGKTRVGIRAASELLEHFEEGTFFVSLAAITDAALVAPAITQTLGVTGSEDCPPEELLKNHLGERHTLLLLDNFEQVLEAALLVDESLTAAPT
jgi:predicted ATPase